MDIVTGNYSNMAADLVKAKDEIDRLAASMRRSDDQWSEIATRLGGDARNVTGDGPKTMAKFVVQEFDRLTAERDAANQRADEARQESIVAAQEAYEAVDEAMKAAKASHNDLRITMPEIAKMNVLRWPWLEEME